MANINSNEVQIKHFLKADTYNEKYTIKRNDSDSVDTEIINGNEEFFDSIILKYSEQPNSQHYIKLINENAEQSFVYSENLDEWISNNIIESINDMLVYVEGYAGCGKTTWVQSILHKVKNEYTYLIYNTDISDSTKRTYQDNYYSLYDSFTPGNEYSSEVIRFNIINSIVIRMVYLLKKEKGTQILNDFCMLLNDVRIEKLNNRLPNIVKAFQKDYFKNGIRRETYFYKNGTLLSQDSEAEKNFIDIFRENINEKDCCTGKYVFSTLDILCIDYIWRVAVNQNTEKSDRLFVCYDNLDIIEDIGSLVDFINDLENLKTNISAFREYYSGNMQIPYFIIFATSRKITSSKLNSCGLHLPSDLIKSESYKNDSNEAAERDARRGFIIKIELSNLYNYERMMKKRAKYFKKHMKKLVDGKDVNKLELMLERVLNLPEGAFKEINYSGLWNHNHRACNNILNRIVSDYSQYYDAIVNKYDETFGTNASILVHLIIKIINENKEWEKSLGYRDNKLTTMSRLILTYLHNKKQRDIESISILDIIKDLGAISLDLDCSDKPDWEKAAYICTTLQNMLNRLPGDNEEMWRRPIYYKNNALVCENKDIQKNLLSQYENSSISSCTSFAITEEGSTFIEKIVPQFEFYSARLHKDSIPLFCISNKNDLIENIDRVYNKVAQCCKRQIIFMERYKEKYNIPDITEYLNKDFHPITLAGDKQLHIIRVIFSHIMFLNSFREYLFVQKDARFNIFNKTLVWYIWKYLNLYEEKFYSIMYGTIGEYNNEVWGTLVEKCNVAVKAIKDNADDVYGTSIERNKSNSDSKEHTKQGKPELLSFNYNCKEN